MTMTLRTLGLDLGIGSCGWGLLQQDEAETSGEIVALGSRCFEVPETDKERKLKNEIRREKRGMRKVIRRRARRMTDIRNCLVSAKLLPADSVQASGAKGGPNPWQCRANGLTRKLTAEELASALLHIAKHRGFRSNSKSGGAASNEAPDEKQKAKAGMARMRELSARYETVGALLELDPEFKNKKRNTDGDYSHTVERKLHEDEVKLLLKRQQAQGWSFPDGFAETYAKLAFDQRPLQDSEDKVGDCPFEKGEKRAPLYSPTFERFRLLTRLNHITLGGARSGTLSPEEVSKACSDFGSQKSLTWSALRKKLNLTADIRLPTKDEKDSVTGGDMAPGTYMLKNAMPTPAVWDALSPEKRDEISRVLSFRESIESDKPEVKTIKRGLEEIGLDATLLAHLLERARTGDFSKFSKSGSLSLKAMRNIIPHLEKGMTYDKACEAAGYDHAAQKDYKLEDLANPVVQRIVRETLKQVEVIVQTYGLPDRIHVEMARDIGKSAEERGKLTKGLEDRKKAKDKNRDAFKALTGATDCTDSELEKYELYREQNERCLYCDDLLDARALPDGNNDLQVDHILPWSRSSDNSFTNRTLCCAGCNQKKGKQTPFEWLGHDTQKWAEFEARVKGVKLKGYKYRNFLMRNFDEEMAERFRSRNLNDTRYACRVILSLLKQKYYKDKTRVHVAARPGSITALVRKSWGLERIKKDAEGKRLGDRHHALDACVVAAVTEGQLQRLTKLWQWQEAHGQKERVPHVPPPWPHFADELKAKLETVFVSRSESGRARGEGHKATMLQVWKDTAYKLVSVDKDFKEEWVDKIEGKNKDNKPAYEAIKEWVAKGKPLDKHSLPKLVPTDGSKETIIKKISVQGPEDAVYERVAIDKYFDKEKPKKGKATEDKEEGTDKVPGWKKTLGNIKDPDSNRNVVEAITKWVEAKKPTPYPLHPGTGHEIRKIRVRTTDKIASGIRLDMQPVDAPKKGRGGGYVANGGMVRVDVFERRNSQNARENGFYFVPVYTHQVMDETSWPEPPSMAASGDLITQDYRFCFSLYPDCYVEGCDGDGILKEGYYRKMDIDDGSRISLSSQENHESKSQFRLSCKNLLTFRKFHIDRLGNKHEVKQEKRTWHGKVCT